MSRRLLKIVLICLLAWIFLSLLWGYRQSSRIPNMPEGAYYLEFFDGDFRAIVLDAEVTTDFWENGFKHLRRLNLANRERRYFGILLEVPEWMKGAWSTCIKPTAEELSYVTESMPESTRLDLQFARLDAVCRVEVEGQEVVMGLIYSVPRI